MPYTAGGSSAAAQQRPESTARLAAFYPFAHAGGGARAARRRQLRARSLLPRCPAACGHGVSLFSPRPVGWDGGGRAGASRQGAVVCFLWDSRAGVEIVAIAAVRRRDSCHLGALARSDGAPVVNGILLCAFLSCLRVIV